MYYLYRHIRLDKNEPFYIGLGKKPKKYDSYNREYSRAFNKRERSKKWKEIVAITGYEVEILFESDDCGEIKRKEIEFIDLYGRIINGTGTLCNLTEGGESKKGYTTTTEVRIKLSNKHKGKILSEEHKQNIGKARIGKKHSPETRVKLSKARKNRVIKDETRVKWRIARLGKPAWNTGISHSEETKNKISKSLKMKKNAS